MKSLLPYPHVTNHNLLRVKLGTAASQLKAQSDIFRDAKRQSFMEAVQQEGGGHGDMRHSG